MGNFSSHPKYYSSKEAIEILGDDTWISLRNQLELCRGQVVDYDLFAKILYCRFERMVSFQQIKIFHDLMLVRLFPLRTS